MEVRLMIRATIGVILSAVLLMAWGFVFWAVSGLFGYIVQKLPNETIVVEALKAEKLASGNYVAPYPSEAVMSGKDEAALKAFREKFQQGPLVQIVYRAEGADM